MTTACASISKGDKSSSVPYFGSYGVDGNDEDDDEETSAAAAGTPFAGAAAALPPFAGAAATGAAMVAAAAVAAAAAATSSGVSGFGANSEHNAIGFRLSSATASTVPEKEMSCYKVGAMARKGGEGKTVCMKWAGQTAISSADFYSI